MSNSYAQGAATPALLEETIGANFERTVARFGDREALISFGQELRYTWTELNDAVDELARGLIAAGLMAGDRVGIWSPNCAEWTLVQYATAKLGVILVNINPAYRTSELEYALRQSGCRMLIAAPAFKTSDYRAMVGEVRGGLDMLEQVVFLGGEDWQALLAGAAAVSADELRSRSAALEPSDPINIQYTSGTTGFPKGATLTHRNILNNGFLVGEGVRYTEADRVCIPVRRW
jgi:fatty-acyl-CoA synthase